MWTLGLLSWNYEYTWLVWPSCYEKFVDAFCIQLWFEGYLNNATCKLWMLLKKNLLPYKWMP